MHSLSRRRFIRKSFGFGTAAAVLPRFALARPVPPSDRIALGFIGLGFQGLSQLRGGPWAERGGFIGRSDVRVLAVCDVNRLRKEAAQKAVNEYYGDQDCAAYHDYQELLGRKDIDAVVIATGDRWHAPLSIAAAVAGKDIYCEKPHTLTIREAQLVAQTMKRYGTVFQVGTQQRSWYEFRFACELIRNSYIGHVESVTVNVGGPPAWHCDAPAEPAPAWLDWNRWLGPAPWRPYTSKIAPSGWMAFRDYSGGEMTNWGAHMFDIAQWALGMDESGPIEIFPPDGKSYRVLTYKYANGTSMTRGPISRDVQGVRFAGNRGWIEVSRDHLDASPATLLRHRIAPHELHLHESHNHQADFLDAVRTRRRPVSDAEVAKRSITVCHLGNIAYWLNRPLWWDPEREDFVDDPLASRMLDREARVIGDGN
ncbi:MAG: Gfo/Idh/MocA family protein [Acidobacteriota bacterium]